MPKSVKIDFCDVSSSVVSGAVLEPEGFSVNVAQQNRSRLGLLLNFSETVAFFHTTTKQEDETWLLLSVFIHVQRALNTLVLLMTDLCENRCRGLFTFSTVALFSKVSISIFYSVKTVGMLSSSVLPEVH